MREELYNTCMSYDAVKGLVTTGRPGLTGVSWRDSPNDGLGDRFVYAPGVWMIPTFWTCRGMLMILR
jgi:hypothetical protein